MSDAAPAVAGVAALVIDCADSPGLANWWSRLLGGSVEVDPERNATLRTLQGLAIDFLPVPDHCATWWYPHWWLRPRDGRGGAGRQPAGATWELLGFLDDRLELAGTRVDGLPVKGQLAELSRYGDAQVVVCVGGRQGLLQPLADRAAVGLAARPLRHGRASVGGVAALLPGGTG
jgi:hypothetical protein